MSHGWNPYEDLLLDTSPKERELKHPKRRCLPGAHQWIDTGFAVTFCKTCEAKGRLVNGEVLQESEPMPESISDEEIQGLDF